MGIEIKTQYFANVLNIADRHGFTAEVGFDKDKTPGVKLSVTDKKITNSKVIDQLVVGKILKQADHVHNHFLVSSYTPKDVKNAVQLLELYVLYEWDQEIDRAQSPSSRDEIVQSKRHMKTINSLEDLHAFVDLPEKDQRKSYISKCKTTAKQVEKIFNDDVLVNQLAFQKPVQRAIKVLTEYHKKLS